MPANCGKCDKVLSKKDYQILCFGKCNRWFCLHCSSLTKAQVRDIQKDDKTWRCHACQVVRRSFIPDSEAASESSSGSDVSLADIMNQLRRMEISHKNEINDIKQSLQFMSDSFEDLKREYKVLHDSTGRLDSELKKSQTRMVGLENRVSHLEQELRSRNVVIMNVPRERDEVVKDIVSKIAGKLDITLHPGDYDCYRASRKQDSPIIARLSSIDLKNRLLSKRRQVRDFKVTSCGLSGADNVIYINEDLIPSAQLLFSVAREFKRSHGYKYLWVSNGKIFIRKNDDSRALHIGSSDDLDRLLD